MNLHDWIDELCDVLDVSTEVDEGLVSDLVTIVGKTVEPSAGPVTAYLLGYAAARGDGAPAQAEQVEQLAARAQGLAEDWDRPPGADEDDDDEVDEVVGEATDLEIDDEEAG